MNFVVAVSDKGLQTFPRDDGKVIEFKKVYISYITDLVPDRYQDGQIHIWATEYFFNPDKVRLIGADSPHDLVGKFIEFSSTFVGGRNDLAAVIVVPCPRPQEEKDMLPLYSLMQLSGEIKSQLSGVVDKYVKEGGKVN